MAPKRPPPVEAPPSASSSEEEEEDEEEEEETSSGEEQEESDDEENLKQTQKPSSPQQHTKAIQTLKSVPKKTEPATNNKPESESESESEPGSESETDSEPESHQNVKPIASKPMEDTPPKAAASAATKKPRSKPATAATPEKSTGAKRGNGTDRDPKDSKRAKNKDLVPDKSDDNKKQLFQRLWTEEDEIAVLEGIIDFTAKKGYDPSKDMNAFLDYIKKSLHFDVSMSQLKDKISRLKKKFENNAKGKKGEDKTFSKLHDQNAFDLSKKIWGSEGSIKANGKKNGDGSSNIKKGNAKKLEALKTELGMDVGEDQMEVDTERNLSAKVLSKFDSCVGVGKLEDFVVRKGLDFVQGAKKVEMEEQWKKLHVAELELFLKRNELIRKQAMLMLEAFKSDED